MWVKDLIPYLEQRSIVEGGGSTGEGCWGQAHAHMLAWATYEQELQGSTFLFAIVFETQEKYQLVSSEQKTLGRYSHSLPSAFRVPKLN